MSDTREKLVDIINDFFGCDAAYFGVQPLDLATHLITNGIILQDELIKIELPSHIDEQKIVEMLCSEPVQILPGESVRQWIPVEEEQPVAGDVVLVYGKRGGIYTAEFYRNTRGYWFHKLNSKNHHCEPTHWMPLPKPPK